jgi:excisionase family DNA binding protein
MKETMTNADPAFLSPSRVAKLLSVCTVTVYRLIHRGVLPAHRVTRRLRVAQADLERYLARVRGHEAYAGT